MAEVLRQIGAALPWVGAGLALIGGLIGLRVVNRGAMRERSDRGGAAVAGFVLAALAGGVTAVFTAMIASSFGGNFLAALPVAAGVFGLPVGVIVFGSATAGYALAARLRPTGNATGGAVAGPLALGAVCLAAVGLVGVANQMSADASYQAYVDEVAARSGGLHLAVDEVTPLVDADGHVTLVHVRLRLRSDTDLGLEQLPEKLVYPLFILAAGEGRDPSAEIQVEAPPGSPDRLAAGVESTYDLRFDATASAAVLAPGDWFLRVRFNATDGLTYGVDQPVSVRP